jgi:hypothetical protein
MITRRLVIGVMAGLLCPATLSAQLSECLPMGGALLKVRIGSGPAVSAVLKGGIETPLALFEATSGNLLWSAAEHASAIHQVAGLEAAITGSLTAIDLDNDGLHDRIYAGDMAGRLWRLDLNHGATATEWASASVFADFSNNEGRGFLAPADVSLSAPPGMPPWLNIAIGTAAPGNPAANNRFYVLRDPSFAPSPAGATRQPVRERDLRHVQTLLQQNVGTLPDPDSRGWYIELGGGHVLTPSLTVSNRAVLVISSAIPLEGAACEVFVRIAELDLLRESIVPASAGEWTRRMDAAVPAGATLEIARVEAGIAECSLAGERIPACDVDTRARRTWWRRTDAE